MRIGEPGGIQRRTDLKSDHFLIGDLPSFFVWEPHQKNLPTKNVSTPHWRCLTILACILILMGKHATEAQKIAFCAHLQHVHLAEAARLAGLGSTVVLRLKK